MTSVLKRHLWIAVVAVSLELCVAQPAGQVSFPFNRSNVPVFDLSGPYALSHPATGAGGAVTDLAFTVGFVHENSGKLSGSGVTMMLLGEDYVAASYTVVGKVSGNSPNPKVDWSVRMDGWDWIAGAARRFSVSLSYRTQLNPTQLTLSGTASGSISIKGIGSSRVKSNIALPLPGGSDGSWTLTLNLLTLSKIGGSGTFAISDYTPVDHPAGFPTDRLLPASASGNYSGSTGLATVQATGQDAGRGSSVKMTFDADNNHVTKLSGKILGQKVKLTEAD